MRIFFDACCFFTAFNSSNGAASLILELARFKHLSIVANNEVVREAYLNLHKKSDTKKRDHFQRTIESGLIELLPSPDSQEIEKWKNLTHEKDCHILASALLSKVDFVITLDKKHLLTSKVKNNFSIQVINPGEFLNIFLPKTEPKSPD